MAEDPRDITDQEFYVDDLRQSRRLAEELERAEREIKDLLAERTVLRDGSRTFYRWAITTDSHGLIGLGWLEDPDEPRPRYPYLIPTMLYRTRREARKALPRVKGPAESGRFPDARVVRVSVLIQVEG